MADVMNTENSPYLLTIAVPTYNRAVWLDLCLSRITAQLPDYSEEIELLVSNNCSTDGTGDVVKKYLSQDYSLTYLENTENVGPDRNFVECYRKARGRYVLLLGDDDVLLDGALDALMPILRGDTYGVVFLSSYGFTGDYKKERPRLSPAGYAVHEDLLQYIKKVAHFFTFMSAIVFNRTLVDEPSDWTPFFSSNLVQLAWTFSALFNGQKHVYISEYMVAARLYNSGNYGVAQVFGHNFNKIFDVFRARGVDEKYFKAINKKLLIEHFPAMIALGRNKVIPLQDEDYFRSLFPLYKGYLAFWLCTVPAIFLPARVVYSLFRIAERILRDRKLAPRPNTP
jgi:abequosyltransferase